MDAGDRYRRPPVTPAGVCLRGASAAPYRPRCLSLRTLTTLFITAVLVMSCGAGGGSSDRDTGGPAGKDSQVTGALQETVVEDDAPTENGEDGFVVSGESSGGEVGVADRIEGVRFRIFDGYERLVVDFGGRDATAGLPRWTVESAEQGGYVRLRFPGISSTQIAHEDFVGSLLDELYVVRDRGGGLFADVFGMHGFHYRVTELAESGRLAVDFRSVDEEIRFPPTTGDRVVVLQPREAEEVESPIGVRGYARLFEGRVTVSLLDRERETIASKTVRATDWTSAWGLFATTIESSGYEGLATIRVGSRSPKDGSFVGTETEVFLESSGPG